MTDYQIHLELRSGDCCVLCARRGDAGRKIRMHLTDGGRRYLPEEGVTAVLSARKSDGNLIYNRCDLEEGAAVFTVTPQTTAMPGLVETSTNLASVKFKEGNKIDVVSSQRSSVESCRSETR